MVERFAACAMTELLDAIQATPDDDALRRVYADALLDDGEPLGELIHLQLDLAGHTLSRDDRAARRQRERELLAEHEARWTAPIAAFVPEKTQWGPVVPNARFRRGFIDEVQLDADTFVARGDELFVHAPLLRGVHLTGMVEEDAADWVLRKFRAAMSSPVLARLHGMRCDVGSYSVHGYDSQTVDHSMIDDVLPPFLDAIARMPLLRALAMFEPEHEIQKLVDSGLFARLDRMDFGNFRAALVKIALDAAVPDRLRSVALPLFDRADLVDVLAHPKLQAVEELSIKKPMFDDVIAPIFEALRGLPKLRRLQFADLRGLPVPPDLVEALEELALPDWPAATVFGWS